MLLRYYQIKPPLVRESRLTTRERGGVGKPLSTGYVANYAIGCTHACPFCYVDSIHKRLVVKIHPEAGLEWDEYLLIPEPHSFEKALRETPWRRWRGELVLMSSTHDPFLPQLVPYAKAILETGLEHGVNFLIQTRSLNALQVLPLLARYRNQVVFQVSIATMSEELRRLIEPRVPPATARLAMLRRAKELGLRVGVIIAPILPPVKQRPNVEADLDALMRELANIGVDQVFGEMLHIRGQNIARLEAVLGGGLVVNKEWDLRIGAVFEGLLRKYGLRGEYWYEYH